MTSRAGTPGAPPKAAPIDCRLCALVFTSARNRHSLKLQLFGRERRESPNILPVFAPAGTGQKTALQRGGRRGKPRLYDVICTSCGGSMRPYLILTAVVLMAVAAFGQPPFRPGYGPCGVYGCGPFIPLLTTPEISLQQFSPNPVGASNATTGLIAGATNSTLSQIRGRDQFGLFRGRVVPGRRSSDGAGGPSVAGDGGT